MSVPGKLSAGKCAGSVRQARKTGGVGPGRVGKPWPCL